MPHHIIADACIGPKCGKCVKVCPVDAIPKKGAVYEINSKCVECMHCDAVCPTGAARFYVITDDEPWMQEVESGK